MKKLNTLLFLLLATTLSYAQDSKPTIEETVQFIKNELNHIGYRFESEDNFPNSFFDYEKVIYTYDYTSIKMDSCLMEVLYNIKRYRTKKYVNYKDRSTAENYDDKLVNDENENKKIDFSKIETLLFSVEEIADYKNSKKSVKGNFVKIYFKQKKDDGTYQNIIIPLGFYSADFDDFTSLKIYKAFQHLRKLCGAPEPISFD